MKPESTSLKFLRMPSEQNRNRWNCSGCWIAGIALEAMFLRMHSLYYLKNHAIGFIELGLAAWPSLPDCVVRIHTNASHAHNHYSTDFCRDCIPGDAVADGADAVRRSAAVPLGREGAGAGIESVCDCAERSAARHSCGTSITKLCRGGNSRRFIHPRRNCCFARHGKCFRGRRRSRCLLRRRMCWCCCCWRGCFDEDKDRDFRLAVYAWNPLVIVEFAGSGHNDVAGAARNRLRTGAGEEMAAVCERAGGAGGDGQGVSGAAAAGVDSQNGLAGEKSGMVGGGAGGTRRRWRCWRLIGTRSECFAPTWDITRRHGRIITRVCTR